jgi:hypothetical protein
MNLLTLFIVMFAIMAHAAPIEKNRGNDHKNRGNDHKNRGNGNKNQGNGNQNPPTAACYYPKHPPERLAWGETWFGTRQWYPEEHNNIEELRCTIS